MTGLEIVISASEMPWVQQAPTCDFLKLGSNRSHRSRGAVRAGPDTGMQLKVNPSESRPLSTLGQVDLISVSIMGGGRGAFILPLLHQGLGPSWHLSWQCHAHPAARRAVPQGANVVNHTHCGVSLSSFQEPRWHTKAAIKGTKCKLRLR